jgi:hypothetical protein
VGKWWRMASNFHKSNDWRKEYQKLVRQRDQSICKSCKIWVRKEGEDRGVIRVPMGIGEEKINGEEANEGLATFCSPNWGVGQASIVATRDSLKTLETIDLKDNMDNNGKLEIFK